MIKKSICFLIAFACSHHHCFAEIIQTNEIKVIEETLASIDQDTLVIFDVDDVLIMPKDQILQSQNRSSMYTHMHKLEKDVVKWKKDGEIFWGVILSQRNAILVDHKIPNIMTALQDKGIKVVALTHAMTGKLGYVTSMKDWRYNELIHHGYDFEKSWKGMKDKTFNGLEKSPNRLSPHVSSPPMFSKGIIFTQIDKGEALEFFLRQYKLQFKRIIFIDDKKKNLESVEKITEKLNIPFVGIEYTAANKHTKTLNEQRADLQFKVLGKEKKWISDSEADALIAHSSQQP